MLRRRPRLLNSFTTLAQGTRLQLPAPSGSFAFAAATFIFPFHAIKVPRIVLESFVFESCSASILALHVLF
ncbi:hypothetical protein L208DRAFT_148632 [Tricholoma matsutake]|nr:hypothetical protein L208DRAFT_148632 [Tricholoma matsutake 945]